MMEWTIWLLQNNETDYMKFLLTKYSSKNTGTAIQLRGTVQEWNYFESGFRDQTQKSNKQQKAVEELCSHRVIMCLCYSLPLCYLLILGT